MRKLRLGVKLFFLKMSCRRARWPGLFEPGTINCLQTQVNVKAYICRKKGRASLHRLSSSIGLILMSEVQIYLSQGECEEVHQLNASSQLAFSGPSRVMEFKKKSQIVLEGSPIRFPGGSAQTWI